MKPQPKSKRLRFAIYTRYSSEMQNEISLEAQEDRCRQAVAARDGVVINVFSDSAKSGWSLDRDGFNQLRREAEKGRFDAVMFWKFDRLARNHDHAVMIKLLLRTEYNLKLYCVEGFSEDEDDSPYTAMMEQMLAIFSAFYSKNLSNETKRGKYQRAVNGEYNGSIAPLGYELVTKKKATDEKPAGLYINPEHAAVVIGAFELYATGEHSDKTVADWMNRQPAIQKLRAGKSPLGKDSVRDLLKNRVYTGRVPYAETQYKGSLGQGRQPGRNRRKWFEGKHEGIISNELYDKCQLIRGDATVTRKPPQKVRTYLLSDRVYCGKCTAIRPAGLTDKNYGKMRPNWDASRNAGYYRCIGHNRGYRKCDQRAVKIDSVDEQIVEELRKLEIPDGFKERVEIAVRNRAENADALARIEALEKQIERIDYSWEQGFLQAEEYSAKRLRVTNEIAALQPIDYDDLTEAADLLEHFPTYWEKCETVAKPKEARKQLLAKIVDRVFLYEDKVIAIALHGDFGIVLDSAGCVPSEVVEGLKEKMDTTRVNSSCVRCGNDGIRWLACKKTLLFVPSYLADQFFSNVPFSTRDTATLTT